MSGVVAELGMTGSEVWLTVVVATGAYGATILMSRLFGQRQFSAASSYDLAFVFAIGSIVGRVILVRTSLANAVLGLLVMFALHAGTGWVHHHWSLAHRLLENRPVVVAADGELWDDGMRKARISEVEVRQALRLKGYASLDDVAAVVLERNGQLSVLGRERRIDPGVVDDAYGHERIPTDQ